MRTEAPAAFKYALKAFGHFVGPLMNCSSWEMQVSWGQRLQVELEECFPTAILAWE